MDCTFVADCLLQKGERDKAKMMTARARVSDAKGVLLQWQNDLTQMKTQIDLDKQLGEGALTTSIVEGLKLSNTTHCNMRERGGTVCSGTAGCALLSSLFSLYTVVLGVDWTA